MTAGSWPTSHHVRRTVGSNVSEHSMQMIALATHRPQGKHQWGIPSRIVQSTTGLQPTLVPTSSAVQQAPAACC